MSSAFICFEMGSHPAAETIYSSFAVTAYKVKIVFDSCLLVSESRLGLELTRQPRARVW